MLQDLTHVEVLRNALWRPNGVGNAALMVGSGLSRNAVPRHVGIRPFPTWRTLVERLLSELYPERDQGASAGEFGRWRDRAEKEAEDVAGFLRLAQEYSAYRGHPELVALVKREVPDQDYVPSTLHDRLMTLPWCDVFTTNWDTLLERSALRAMPGRYQTLYDPSQLSSIPAPRIVKLHGTLGLPGDIVFSEEDFRSYGTLRAPFVNLVRQSMMEKVFCLLGFSGTDPNFLNWIGWVRDELGASANRVKLIGLLDLSPSRRQYLHDLQIDPVDLAPVVGDDLPEGERHRAAFEWLLATLEAGKPFALNFWPEARGRVQAQQGRRWVVSPLDLADPGARMCVGEPDLAGGGGREVVSDMKAVRLRYPGWVVVPARNRKALLQRSKVWLRDWKTLSAGVDGASLKTRWELLFELLWRSINGLRIVGTDMLEAVDEGDVRLTHGMWLQLERMVIRAYQLRGESRGTMQRLVRYEKALSPDDADGAAFACHVRCLEAFTIGDVAAISQALREWPIETSDFYWNTRKAGVLAELGRLNEALVEARASLREFRSLTRSPQPSIDIMSREGWTALLTKHLCQEIRWQVRKEEFAGRRPRMGELDRDIWEIEERFEELHAKRCNAEAELDMAISGLRQERDETGEIAHELIALVDEVGLPYTCGGSDVVKTVALEAARRLEKVDVVRAVRTLIRAAPDAHQLEKFQVATTPQNLEWTGDGLERLADLLWGAAAKTLENGPNTVSNRSDDPERYALNLKSTGQFITVLRLACGLLPLLNEWTSEDGEPRTLQSFGEKMLEHIRSATTSPGIGAIPLNLGLLEEFERQITETLDRSGAMPAK